MDVDWIIDSELHEEGRKQAAWEKAYYAALYRWEYELSDDVRAKLIEEQLEGDLLEWLAHALARRGNYATTLDSAYTQARDAWATEQARTSLENTEGE